MRILWLLEEMGLDYDLVVHEFGPNLHEDSYRALHPAGRVPVLEDGDLRLCESGAITEYLCETHDSGGLWRAPGDPERPAWLQWLHFAETMAQHIAALTQQHIVIREDKDRSPVVMKLEAKRLARTISALRPPLDQHPYLLERGFSAIDVSIGYSLYIARHFVDFTEFPAQSAYYARLSERPAFVAALPPTEARLIYVEPFYAAWSGE